MIASIFTDVSSQHFWNALFGAGLGASFYTLLEMRPYLVNRSYDPKYSNAYLVRFVTGLVAGVILGFVFDALIPPTTGSEPAAMDAIKKLGPGVVAILGGFSAEAVQQILIRLVEVLVTMVNGSGANQAQANAQVAEAKKSADALMLLPDLEKNLANPAEAKKALEALRQKLKSQVT